MTDWSQLKVYVTGHTGLVGSALVRALSAAGCHSLVTAPHAELDLTEAGPTLQFIEAYRPDVIFHPAARVGGIAANLERPTEFLAENVAIAQNVILSAHQAAVPRLLFFSSGCIYPKNATMPLTEDKVLTGPFEPTNEGYALAKVTGMKLCQMIRRQYGRMYHSIIPNNLYGPGDNYHPERSHVIPGLLRRLHEAKIAHAPEVEMWGTGSPLREFMHVDDLASAALMLASHPAPPDWVNAGSGTEVSILQLTELIAEGVSYTGRIVPDPTRPDGMPRKWLDSSWFASQGWEPQISLRDGLARTYAAFSAQ
jgi:GDP-L-fucose synthase